ncbi:MAG: hypothetical protein D8M57_10670 [Candidatus Scalindua sp. AMX11]|nr:MAG: hypothetical protein DWQ00_03335 [Candidatus Scalindua sp.]TDE64911.1 MAG: hypothetical protein D8M57_10670 [Candidatus Scalindua sp. AMX11]
MFPDTHIVRLYAPLKVAPVNKRLGFAYRSYGESSFCVAVLLPITKKLIFRIKDPRKNNLLFLPVP